MEPMMLSPGSPGSPCSQYLPGFLLGDPQEISGVLDDPRSRRSPASNSFIKSPKSLSVSHHTPDYNRGSKSRVEGPPTQGLFDDIGVRVAAVSNDQSLCNASYTLDGNTTLYDSVCCEADGSLPTEKEGFWVVVFGFPASHLSQVLGIFTQLGRVVETSFPTSGNWFHIKYESKMEVRKALAHNERIICGNIMIGVAERRVQPACPTQPRECLSQSFASPVSALTSPKSPTLRTLQINRRGDTPLNESYVTPTKNTSVVTKAMDLLFGW